jgi:hypothetical protein
MILNPFTYQWNVLKVNPSLWLDASDISTITQSSGKVSQWDDKSGNGNHLTQATSGLQPTLNGNGLDFVSADKLVKSSPVNVLSNDGTSTIFLVHDIIDPSTSVDSFFNILDNQADTTDPERRRPLFYYAKSSAEIYHSVNSAGGSKIEADLNTGKSIICGVQSATTNTFYLDGVSKDSVSITPDTTTTSASFSLGDLSNQNLTIKINEVILFTEEISESDRQKIEGYLAHKWGLEDKLPYDHPYRYDGRVFGYPKLFTPSELTTSLWLDAYDEDTITESSGSVSAWNDKSGNDNHAVQVVGANQPTISGNSMDFDGINQYFTCADSPSLSLTSSFSVFFVLDVDIFNGGNMLSKDANNTYRFRVEANQKPWTLINDGTIVTETATSTIDSDTNILMHYFDAGNSLGFYGNGTSLGESATSKTNIQDTSGEVKIGTYISGDEQFDGALSEILIIPELVSTLTRQKVEGYLAWKWGLEDKLPSDHPHKSAPPTV